MASHAKDAPVCQIFSFQDCKTSPDPVFEPPARCLGPAPVPIVIDNGSFQTRAGWASAAAEFASPLLQFRSVAARSRGAARSETQIGNDIANLEPLRWLLKSQFDRNVVVNFEIQELIFDYVFTHLGIASEVRGGWGRERSDAPTKRTLDGAVSEFYSQLVRVKQSSIQIHFLMVTGSTYLFRMLK